MVERKLIRPNLRDYKGSKQPPREVKEVREVREVRAVREPDTGATPQSSPPGFVPARRKQVPPEQTNAENFYYLKQMTSKTPMIFVLNDGEELRGWIEWYDRTCLKIHRSNEANLLVYKSAIKYMFKEREV
jgi:sRNA-binding regulator protein Hfq